MTTLGELEQCGVLGHPGRKVLDDSEQPSKGGMGAAEEYYIGDGESLPYEAVVEEEIKCGKPVLLQGEVLQKTMAKNTLRQRIYSTALDYFCAEKTYPTQSGPAVTEDVQVRIPLSTWI